VYAKDVDSAMVSFWRKFDFVSIYRVIARKISDHNMSTNYCVVKRCPFIPNQPDHGVCGSHNYVYTCGLCDDTLIYRESIRYELCVYCRGELSPKRKI